MIKLRADLKCYLCGRMAGQLECASELVAGPRVFRPAPGMESLVGIPFREARCPRCGGTLFVDEVEQVYELSAHALRPEKRGRKPRQRVEVAVS